LKYLLLTLLVACAGAKPGPTSIGNTAPTTSEPPLSPSMPSSGGGSDRDGDGVPDDNDRCPDEPEDFDGFVDNDGCPDPDNDQDGISDAWEAENGLNDNNTADAALDTDNDGLTGLAEYRAGANPNAWDSDGDTLADGMDVGANLNPLQNHLGGHSDNGGVRSSLFAGDTKVSGGLPASNGPFRDGKGTVGLRLSVGAGR